MINSEYRTFMYVRGTTNTAKNLWDCSYILESGNTYRYSACLYILFRWKFDPLQVSFLLTCLQVKSINVYQRKRICYYQTALTHLGSRSFHQNLNMETYNALHNIGSVRSFPCIIRPLYLGVSCAVPPHEKPEEWRKKRLSIPVCRIMNEICTMPVVTCVMRYFTAKRTRRRTAHT